MTIASGAGAEVQKPLATVGIGGLITATLLTVLYAWMMGRRENLTHVGRLADVPPAVAHSAAPSAGEPEDG